MFNKKYQKVMKILENQSDDVLRDNDDLSSIDDFVGHKVSEHPYYDNGVCNLNISNLENVNQYDGEESFDPIDEGRRTYWGDIKLQNDFY